MWCEPEDQLGTTISEEHLKHVDNFCYRRTEFEVRSIKVIEGSSNDVRHATKEGLGQNRVKLGTKRLFKIHVRR